MPKIVQTTVQLQAKLQQYVNPNFQIFKLDLEKAEEPMIKLLTSFGSQRKQENSRKKIYFCFIDYTKAFDYVDHNKPWKILKEMGIPEHLTCHLRKLYAGQKETELDMEQCTVSKLKKEHINAVHVTLRIQLICRVRHVKCHAV